MDISQKKSILTHLAKKAEPDSAALQAIQKECNSITSSLQNETRYDDISHQIELLQIIAYRVYKKAVDTIRNLLNRLVTLELTYEETPDYPARELSKYQNNHTLMIKAIETLERIRYHQSSDILDIFFKYSCHENEGVSKQAKLGIEKLAEYNLDIFYGDGKKWAGLGWEPQKKVLELISSFSMEHKQKYFSGIIVACQKILSPTISGTSSTYKTVTWRTGTVPAKEGVNKIRKKTLEELQKLYEVAEDIEQKKSVLNAMDTATRTPHMSEYEDDVLAMIVDNTVTVTEFMKKVALTEDMPIMQKIEHDAYWMLHHKGKLDSRIHKICLEIRDQLYANEEYQKFRFLIGFESIFHDWENDRNDIEQENKFREEEVLKLAENINTVTYEEWKDRIIQYARIKSNDMATFPYFGKFLEHFGKTSPILALQLLSESSEQLENFLVALFCGVAETEHKNDAYALIDRWCDEDKYLFSLARFFEYSSEINEELLTKILDKAKTTNELNTLNQIISSVSAQYSENNKHLIKTLFMPALEVLTTHKNTNWIFGFWFRKQRSDILADMELVEHKAILENLFWLKEIDYHAEEILCEIANQSAEMVIQFFVDRLSMEKDEEDTEKYDAIPFNFHKLSEPLSKHPDLAVEAIQKSYDGNYGMFIYRGARLLKNMFPNFPSEFQQKLLKVAQSEDEKDILFVMAILRNYDGEHVILEVCKELVKILPENSSLENELSVILQSTGVVSGEYGFVEAYKKKIVEIQFWLEDENTSVKEYAKKYIEDLSKQIEYEQKRSDENIAIRKHQYGSDEN